jgi:uncharacterized protein RhaS with RHS repeats
MQINPNPSPTHWSDNRIGFNESSAWQYDAQGNRAEQATQHTQDHYSRQRLFYDGANQLTAIFEEPDLRGFHRRGGTGEPA